MRSNDQAEIASLQIELQIEKEKNTQLTQETIPTMKNGAKNMMNTYEEVS